jgi:putative dimethyl sulfoxide reductase chaperone
VTEAWDAARGQLYRFLAGAFLRPPTTSFVAPFLDAEVLGQLEARFGSDALAELRAFRETFQGDYAALDQEYQQLFMVPLGRYVTPYEAVYRDERVVGGEVVRGLLMGPSTLAVTQLYREAGLEIAEDFLELPDHVGLELACMASLCGDEARARERGDDDGVARARELEERLLGAHLLGWVPSLCARVRENAAGPFYRGIAALTEAFLRQEAEEGVATARLA